MEEDDTNNTVKDDGINGLIHGIFSPMENNFDDIHDVSLLEESQQLFMKAEEQTFFML